MPPKRIAIGRSTNQAKRRREERASETSEQRKTTQERDRDHTALARSLKTSEQRQARQPKTHAQDAMTYVRAYGRPDIFITFTCNSARAEIKELLLTGQSPSDRHDISARVFKQKLKSLTDFIVKHHAFGETLCWKYSIEWQKRGLPYEHILIWRMEKITPN
ncbi:helitron_like_N domain-containing protein [Trichonephila clavipes]|nr:helitron_like_N domain-containing protein [Trichonephila clavipes]